MLQKYLQGINRTINISAISSEILLKMFKKLLEEIDKNTFHGSLQKCFYEILWRTIQDSFNNSCRAASRKFSRDSTKYISNIENLHWISQEHPLGHLSIILEDQKFIKEFLRIFLRNSYSKFSISKFFASNLWKKKEKYFRDSLRSSCRILSRYCAESCVKNSFRGFL